MEHERISKIISGNARKSYKIKKKWSLLKKEEWSNYSYQRTWPWDISRSCHTCPWDISRTCRTCCRAVPRITHTWPRASSRSCHTWPWDISWSCRAFQVYISRVCSTHTVWNQSPRVVSKFLFCWPRISPIIPGKVVYFVPQNTKGSHRSCKRNGVQEGKPEP